MITCPEDLAKIGNDSDYPLDGIYYLNNDITFEDQGLNGSGANGNFDPIGTQNDPFTGIFYGNGHTIFGLETIVYTDGPAASGLFGYICDAYISDVILLDGISTAVSFTGAARAGGIAAMDIASASGSTIVNCTNGNNISAVSSNGVSSAGGIIGRTQSTSLHNCCNMGQVSSSSGAENAYSGGIVGFAQLKTRPFSVTGSFNTGTVQVESTAKDARAGGMIGSLDVGVMTASYDDVVVSGCYNTAPIYSSGGTAGSAQVGGILGEIENSAASGLTPNTTRALVKECYNTGIVIGDAIINVFAGGIVGEIDRSGPRILECYNTGGVIGTKTGSGGNFFNCGGIAGATTGQTQGAQFVDCYSIGNVTIFGPAGETKLYIGGVVGNVLGTNPRILNCYYLTDTLFINPSSSSPTPVANALYMNSSATLKVDDGTASPARTADQKSGAKTDAQLRSGSVFYTGTLTTGTATNVVTVDGWDFENIWAIIPEANNGTPTLISNPQPNSVQYGDVNGDGVVNITDALMLVCYLEGLPDTSIVEKAADVNADGCIDIFDATILARHIAEWPGYLSLPYLSVINTKNIIATSDSNSTVSPEGVSEVLEENSITYSFSAKTGYSISSVEVDGILLTPAQIDVGSYTFTNVTEDHTIDIKSAIATFEIAATSDSNSMISPSWVVYVQYGGSQTIAFSSNAGYEISSVTVDGINLTPVQIASGSYTFTNLIDNHTIDVRSTLPAIIWTTHILNYDANGGTGAPPEQTVTDTSATSSMTISSTVPIRDDYEFSGWTTTSGGTGTLYQPGDNISVGIAAVTLYAKWINYTHTLEFNANGGTGAPASIVQTDTSATSSMTIPSTVPARVGYEFDGWTAASDGTGTIYQPDDLISVEIEVTLYAKWVSSSYTHTLEFNANGGTGAPASIEVTDSSATLNMTIPSTVPIWTDHAFLGWTAAADGSGTVYQPGSTILVGTDAITLYAFWAAVPPYVNNTYYAPTLIESKIFPNTNGLYQWGDYIQQDTWILTTGQKLDGYVNYFDVHSYTIHTSQPIPPGVRDDQILYKGTLSFTGTPTTPGTYFREYDILFTDAADTPGYYNVQIMFIVLDGSITHTLSFDANGGEGAPPIQVIKDLTKTTAMAIPDTIPTRAGYDFAGWTITSNGTGTIYQPGATISSGTAPITLYAKWVTYTHTLNYNANGGTGAPAAQAVTDASTTTSLTISSTVPARANYSFAGWTTASNGTGAIYQPGDTIPIGTAAIMLYAKWATIYTHTLNYNANGGTGIPASEIVKDTLAISPIAVSGTVPSRANYIFAGWNTVPNGTGVTYLPGESIDVGTSAVTLSAMWYTAASSYTHNLSFYVSPGTGAPATQTTADSHAVSKITIPSVIPTRSGYMFLGWNTSSAGTGTNYQPGGSVNVGTAAVTLYAVWAVPYTHTLNFNANNGTGAPASTVITDANTTASITIPPTVPARTGYVFSGWNTNAAGTGTNYQPGDTVSVGSAITLYAKWTWMYTHTLNLNANGGDGAPTAQTKTDSNATAPIQIPFTVPARAGYTFAGWNTAANGSGISTYLPGTYVSVGGAAVTLYAKWTMSAYVHTIYYDFNGGTGGPDTQSITTANTAEVMIVPSATPVREGYVFNGWSSAGHFGTYLPGSLVNVGTTPVTLTANWAYEHTLSFNANGGTGAPAPKTYLSTSSTYTHTIPLNVPTRSGYIFAGWTGNADGTGKIYLPGESITISNLGYTLYAKWSTTSTNYTHTLNFNANGGTGAPATVTATNTLTVATINIPLTVPTRNGYTFSCWKTSASGWENFEYRPGDMIEVGAAPVMLYAQWTVGNPCIITGTADSNSNLSPNGATQADKGKNFTYTFSAKPGYYISSLTIDGEELPRGKIALGSYTFTNVNTNHTIDVKSMSLDGAYGISAVNGSIAKPGYSMAADLDATPDDPIAPTMVTITSPIDSPDAYIREWIIEDVLTGKEFYSTTTLGSQNWISFTVDAGRALMVTEKITYANGAMEENKLSDVYIVDQIICPRFVWMCQLDSALAPLYHLLGLNDGVAWFDCPMKFSQYYDAITASVPSRTDTELFDGTLESYYMESDRLLHNGFINYNDPFIYAIAQHFLKATSGWSDIARVNYVLKFVQNIPYQTDTEYLENLRSKYGGYSDHWNSTNTCRYTDYWKLPIETLWDGKGDCEDFSILFVSIIKAMGYDAVFYCVDKSTSERHFGAGVAVPGGSGVSTVYNGKTYYYCEATFESLGFQIWNNYNVGQMYNGYSVEDIQCTCSV